MSPVPSRGAFGRFAPRGTPNLQNIPMPRDVAERLTALINPTRPQPPAPAPKRLVNRIALVLDSSGSMERLYDAARKFANEQISAIKNKAAETGQETTISIMTFAEPAAERFVVNNLHFQAAPLLDNLSYPGPGGKERTALNDAVFEAANALHSVLEMRDADVSYLVITLTDGQENGSRRFAGQNRLASVLRSFDAERFSFAFLVPPGASGLLERNGVPAGNIREWELSRQGLERVAVSTQAGVSSYYATRSAGGTNTKSFYETDLSAVSKADLKKLTDLSSGFYKLQVKAEGQIKAFIEAELGRPYTAGAALYELTKRETIQGHKELVVMERATGKLYGGQEARELVGIKSGPGVSVRVRPGNHGPYKLFVSSTSTNRILVRGTTVLYKKGA